MTAQIIPVDPDNARTLARHAAEIRRIGKQTVSGVIEMGRRLIECKKLAGHGNWLPWLEKEFGWTDKTAENFMNVARFSADKIETVSNLNLPMRGLYLLAKPSTPETAKQEAISRAEAGEPVTLNTVKAIVRHANAAPATPAEGPTRKKPHGRPPKLLPVGTIVEAEFEYARFFRGGFLRGPIEHITDCGGNCERRDDGHYDYVMKATAVISGEHMKKVRQAGADGAEKSEDRAGKEKAEAAVIHLDPEQVYAVDHWRQHFVEDLPTREEAIVRLMQIGLKEEGCTLGKLIRGNRRAKE
jgi:hypothetical protein